MQTQKLDREEQWIAKYRSALDAFPRKRVSPFDHLANIWKRLSEKLAIRFRHTLGEMQNVMHHCRSDKGWTTRLPMRRLRRQS
jgi:hypothetical protein